MRKFNDNKKQMQTNIFKALPYLIIVGLVIALSVTQCQKQTIKQTVSTPDSTTFYKGKIATIQAQGAAEIQKLHSDLLEIKATATVYKKAADKATKERDVARKQIQQLVNASPELKQFIIVDSISDKINRERIEALGLENVKITDDFLQIVHLKDEELKVNREYTNHLEVVVKDLTHEVKKQIRLKTVWKIVSSVLVAVLFYEVVTN